MDYRYSEEIQKITNSFFGKATNACRPTRDSLNEFIEASDAAISPYGGQTAPLEQGFDLGVRYAQARFDAKLNSKPLPDIWLACAPETNHFFLGTEQSVIDHLVEAAKNLELESCVCSAMTLFNHGCQCNA